MNINQRLFLLLTEKGFKKADLAKATGIKANTISDWETKGTNPQADKIARICEFLGVSCDYLLTGKESLNQKLQYDSILSYIEPLDEIDKAEIRGVVKGMSMQMLKSEKYYKKTDTTSGFQIG